MKKLLSVILVLALLLPCIALAEAVAVAETVPVAESATITVTGAASVTLKADYARISVGVSSKAATVEQAANENNAAIYAVIEALKEAGVLEEDIATSNYTVYAEYDYSSLDGQKLSDYNVTNQLTVIIRDMEHIGATLDKATSAGANNIYSIEFLSTKADEAQDEATVYAVQDAMRKASLLASAAGLELGGIKAITEADASYGLVTRSYASKLDAVAGNSILPDDTSVSASVTIVFELK